MKRPPPEVNPAADPARSVHDGEMIKQWDVPHQVPGDHRDGVSAARPRRGGDDGAREEN